MGYDPRIGKHFLKAGAGFGGFCFPKDLDAFIRISEKIGYDFKLLKATKEINENQKKVVVKKVEEILWIVKEKRIAILGLAFKPNTDDMRCAPSIDIIDRLKEEGAYLKVFDPVAMENAMKIKPTFEGVTFCKDPYDVLTGADLLIIMTEWDDFKKLDMEKVKSLMRYPRIVDARNIYSHEEMEKLGFIYKSIGR